MEFGIYSFVENTADPSTGRKESAHKRMRDLLEEIQLCEQVGLDVYAVGEHHRPEYLASSPTVILAAAAERTKKIRLASAVTVLSSDDPVRVFQDFATLDLISGGRAEIMAGRGSFIESFPLFGYDLKDYDSLFAEKLDLLIRLNESEFVTWKGKHRPSIDNLGVYPRPHQDKIPIWLAVGGTPQSAIRAGKLGLPLALAIIGGSPVQFVPFIDLYRETFLKSGHDIKNLQIGINSHLYVAENSQQAADEFYPTYAETMSRIGRERGWQAMTRPQYESMRTGNGSLLVGDPEEVAEKIIYQHGLFKNTRFLAQVTVGTMSHHQTMKAIELFGTQVVPAVKRSISP